ncbi:MAG: dodecin domain-containing protein [Chloroflexi bacterium]|nr:dodecin domain-containing protein [Chloroflexota bacterium]
MADSTYKVIQLVGTSETGIEDAVRGALGRASQTIHNLDWFEVKEIRGSVAHDGGINWFQVKVDVGFKVLDPSDLQKG